MDTLTTWPSKFKYGVVPPLNNKLDNKTSFDSTRGRKKFTVLYFCVSNCTRIRPVGCWRNSLVSRSEASGGIQALCVKCEFLYGPPILKLMPFIKPKRSKFEPLVALAWALEQQTAGTEVNREDNDSSDSFLVGIEGENHVVCFQNLDEVHAIGKICSEQKEQNNITIEEDQKEVENTRIDVRAVAKCLQSAHTVEDVEQILKEYGELPPQVYSSMIRGLGKDQRIDSALILLSWMKRKSATDGLQGPNIFIYNSLLGAVKQSGAFAETEKLLSDMIEEGINPNVVTYNTLMSIYIVRGQYNEALGILEEIQRRGLTPSPVSYSQAMLTYRRMEDGDGALKFFIELRKKYHQGEIGQDEEDWENEFVKLENFTIRVCYQVMRGWLVMGGDFISNVLKLLTSMDFAEIPMGRVELERLVWACTLEEHYNVAKELYARIREKHADISLSVCNHVIWLMGKSKKWWAALEVYEDLLEKGPHPNNLSYELIISHFNILLTAARKKGLWRWGVRLLNKMEEKGLKPRSRDWNAVLIACSKASETTAAVQIFKRMVEQGEKPTVISYGALLSALEKGKLYDEAVQVWNHMLNVGVEPNAYVYTIMASIHTAQGNFKTVDAIIQEMSVVGIELTAVTYNAIISGCAQNGMSSVAYEWFHRMRVQKISPNEITYEMLIEALAKDGKPRLAYEQYLRAQNEGMQLSSKAYDAVVKSSQVHGATIDARVLGPRPPDNKKNKENAQVRRSLNEFYNLAGVPRNSPPFDRKEIFNASDKEEDQ